MLTTSTQDKGDSLTLEEISFPALILILWGTDSKDLKVEMRRHNLYRKIPPHLTKNRHPCCARSKVNYNYRALTKARNFAQKNVLAIAARTRIGRYEICSQIGAGGMGEVYLAQDTKPESSKASWIFATRWGFQRTCRSVFRIFTRGSTSVHRRPHRINWQP